MERHISVSGFELLCSKKPPNILMSLASEECSCRVFKATNELESTGNENEGADKTCSSDETTDRHSPGKSSSKSKCQQASQLWVIDKHVGKVLANEVPANVQH